MGLFSWSRRRPDDRVLLLDVAPAPPPDPSVTLFAVVAEAMILQDDAEAVLAAVGRQEHLGVLAPRGGPLVQRFFALQERLPRDGLDEATARRTRQLDIILVHHALQVATSLDFLAVAGRSEQMAGCVATMGGLGAAAELLEEIYLELKAERRTTSR